MTAWGRQGKAKGQHGAMAPLADTLLPGVSPSGNLTLGRQERTEGAYLDRVAIRASPLDGSRNTGMSLRSLGLKSCQSLMCCMSPQSTPGATMSDRTVSL